MKNTICALTLLLIGFSAAAQEVGYDVFGKLTHPKAGPFSLVTLDTLQGAKTLNDLRARYPASWVARYNSVTISSRCTGVPRQAIGANDQLTPEQLAILKTANEGCRIDVEVDYLPQNELKDNPSRKMNFALTVVPIFEAKFPGGGQQLKAYLKENIVDKIAASGLELPALTKASFTVNEQGQVIDNQILTTSSEDYIDRLILAALNKMPTWMPAKNAKGARIRQEFEFTMGTDLLRCDYTY